MNQIKDQLKNLLCNNKSLNCKIKLFLVCYNLFLYCFKLYDEVAYLSVFVNTLLLKLYIHKNSYLTY